MNLLYFVISAEFKLIPEEEHLNIVRRLVHHKGGNSSILDTTRDCHNNTHLHAAAREGRINVINYLLQNNANVNVQNAYGETPLYLATAHRHTNVIITLLEHGADIAIVNDNDGNTPLHVAAQGGQFEAVGWLCLYGGDDILTARNKDGWTSLDLAKNRRLDLERMGMGNPVSTIRLLEGDIHLWRTGSNYSTSGIFLYGKSRKSHGKICKVRT
jgi:Ankyrin repeats (3 copies)/Ankyrin repeat